MPKEKKTKTNPNRIRPKTKIRLSVESQDRNGNRTSELKTLFRKDVAARQKAVADEVAARTPEIQQRLDKVRHIPDEDDQWEDDNTVTYDDVVDGRRQRDTRNRWDILQRRVNGFRQQMEAMTDAYMKFTAAQGGRLEKEPPPVPPELVENAYTVMIVDIFTLGIQAWMKALSDLQGAAFKPYSTQQFTTCFDLYLGILEEVDNRVNKALQRDSKDWRLKNCCPACTYKLKVEGQLYFSMLATCDGNNSLKGVLRKDKGFTEDGVPLRGGCERPDPRAASASGDYFISRLDVDRWVKERLAEEVVLPTRIIQVQPSKDGIGGTTRLWHRYCGTRGTCRLQVQPALVAQRACGIGSIVLIQDLQDILDPEEASACEERWKNLSEELTSKMWGIFDETGIFLALCRHSFVLLVADMVRSGELDSAKYALAIENVMMDAFGKDIGLGYDIGCGHAKTLKNSPLGPKAKEHNFSLLVGAFHGHAHNRWCQLQYLATYVEGMGIEDLEGCLFGTFLVNNYKQAVGILNTEKTVKYAMAQAGVTEEMMEARLEEEKVYLDGLSVEPVEETDHMEYYQQLVNLADRREKFKDVFAEGSTANGTTRRHAKENYDRAVETVRWTTEDPEWIQAAELVTMRRYQRAINTLEGLVVKRILKLTKVNQSGLAYKLRDHIAKALKARSKAIRNALNRYNTAAAALDPPGRLLTWAEVVDYTFLSEFNILRNPDTTSSIRAWATPAARQLLDSYYKLKRAREEIQRLNIEIRRFVTHMKDKRTFLVQQESEIKAQDPVLAFFVRKFDDVHSKRLQAMKDKLGPAFTGTLQPGIRVSPPVPPVPNPEEQGTVPSEPSMPPMPLPDVEPETTEMNIDEPAGGEDDEGSQDGWLLDDGSSDEDEGPDAEGELSAVLEGVASLGVDRE
ncbi:hypothetical protein K438DRAFT_1774574 [Mycena galopus ATCC 62051]|nr:hypothetical protein K438DRAFT_1774574 [Mycena galopus ATCC 62051]